MHDRLFDSNGGICLHYGTDVSQAHNDAHRKLDLAIANHEQSKANELESEDSLKLSVEAIRSCAYKVIETNDLMNEKNQAPHSHPVRIVSEFTFVRVGNFGQYEVRFK